MPYKNKDLQDVYYRKKKAPYMKIWQEKNKEHYLNYQREYREKNKRKSFEMKDESITLRISKEIKSTLEDLARNDKRTLSNYINNILECVANGMIEYDEATGYLWEKSAIPGSEQVEPKKTE